MAPIVSSIVELVGGTKSLSRSPPGPGVSAKVFDLVLPPGLLTGSSNHSAFLSA